MVPISQSTLEKTDPTSNLSMSEPLRFFTPLAVTSLLTVVTHSLFNAGLARLPSPEIYLAAFSVAKSLMNLVQSPMMMIRQTVAALVEDGPSYFTLTRFVGKLILGVTVSLLVVAFTPVGRFLLGDITGLTGRTLLEAETILKVLVLFPAAITLRNFAQGIVIRLRMTPIVTVGTAARIIYVSLMVLAVPKLTFMPGAVVAGLLLLGAGCCEAVILFAGLRATIKSVPRELNAVKQTSSGPAVDSRLVFSFFWPLAVTAFIRTLAIPLVNLGLARSQSPELAISAFSVAWSLGMIVISPLMMFHQVPMRYADRNDKEKTGLVRKLAVLLGSGLCIVMTLMAFSGAGYYLLRTFIGATHEISTMAVDVLRLMSPFPAIVVAREFYWGMLMQGRQTTYIGAGKVVNLAALTVTLVVMILVGPKNPAITGIVSMLACQAAETLYLIWVSRHTAIKNGSQIGSAV